MSEPLTPDQIEGLRAHYDDPERFADIHALLATIDAANERADKAEAERDEWKRAARNAQLELDALRW